MMPVSSGLRKHLIVWLLPIGFLACGGEAGPPPPDLDKVLLSLPEQERSQVLDHLAQTGEEEPVWTPPDQSSDSELADDLPAEEGDAAFERWQTLRKALLEQRIRLWNLEQDLRAWQSIEQSAADRSSQGVLQLQALAVLNDLQEHRKQQVKSIAGLRRKLEKDRERAGLRLLSADFTRNDWLVIALYLIFTTVLGAALAGKQATIRDFFLGGRKLPWPAVCGSIIATELSAATFLIAPAIVFAKGGDLTYIQLAVGTIIARFIIGYFFVPAFYQREIYSPYDYMGDRLGRRAKNITTFLFMVGAILAQGARVYIAALALQVITGTNIASSVIIIGLVSIAWTWMGGIRTVIWTDVIQFLLFFAGAVVALVFIHRAVDGGLAAVFSQSHAAGKLKFLNTNLNTKEAYTLWCGLFASGFLTLASHGTDQMLAQRIFTCRGPREARKAIIWSSGGILLTLLLLFVGAGLFVYYHHHPLSAAEQAVVDAQSMKIFAVFIVNVLPVGVSGLLMAGIFATAISTLDSVLAARAQTTVSSVYRPLLKPAASDRHYLAVSRVLVILWGVVMTGFAIFCDYLQQSFSDLIQFALAMAAYTYGPLLGAFLLAFLPTGRDDRGLLWGVPLSMLAVFALNWHTPAAQIIVVFACLALVVFAFRELRREPAKVLLVSFAAGLVMIVSLAVIGHDANGAPQFIELIWPWHYPIGTGITLGLGYAVGRRRKKA